MFIWRRAGLPEPDTAMRLIGTVHHFGFCIDPATEFMAVKGSPIVDGLSFYFLPSALNFKTCSAGKLSLILYGIRAEEDLVK